MKKLLIVSLFLLSMIGLFAQNPYTVAIDLQTESLGYHPAGTVGIKVVEFYFGNEAIDGMFDVLYGTRNTMYWNWPNEEDLNASTTQYLGPDDADTPGRLLVQMQYMTNFGAGGGNVHCNFWFIDGDGNEHGPVDISKTGADQQLEANPVAWGGPTGPVAPDAWATYLFPADGATGVGINDADMDMNYPNLGWNYEGTVEPDGFEVWLDGAHVDDVAFEADNTMFGYIHPADLAYETTYTWGIKPYIEPAAKRGMKASRVEPERLYPEGDMPADWTFTTKAAPAVGPDAWATVDTPADEATGVELMPTLTWTYEGTVVPDGYEVYVDGFYQDDVVALEFAIDEPLEYNTEYEWYVKPFVNNAAKKGLKKTNRDLPPGKLYPGGDMPIWTFTTTDEVVIGDPENPNDIVINITIPAGGTYTAPVEVPVTVGQEIAGIVIPSGLQYFSSNIGQASGIYTFVFNFGWSDIVVYYGDNPVDPADYTFVGGVLTIIIDFGAKGPTDIFAYDPNTLPVTLSSFTAVAHANEYVTLKWVTESESNLQGYNVYRAETDNQAQAIRINPTIVAPHNQTQTQTYTYTDNEVESTTYYYWLEVSELANENSFHGPIVVTVEDDPVVPGITETTFRNFGPSPFTTSTSTSLRVKEGETATVTIYNLLGQVVRRESFNAGEHNFEFDGRDANNKKVANGIYFVRMTSPTQTKNFKIVKIK